MKNCTEKLFTISGLTFSYPTGPFGFTGIDLQINCGERLAIIGPNGSGKSSLARILAGLEGDVKGEILYKGVPLKEGGNQTLRDEVGIFFQDPDDMLFCNSVLEDVAFWPKNQQKSNDCAEKLSIGLLRQVGLADLAGKSPHNLSYGQKKRVALAAVLAGNPETIILDEPTANLDKKNRAVLVDLVKRHKGTLILISHDYLLVQDLCDRVVCLGDGKVLSSTKTEDCRTLDAGNLGSLCYKISKGERGTQKTIQELRNYWFRYGDGSYGLRGINLPIAANEGVAIIGENGAGKSTLAKCLASVFRGQGDHLFQGEIIDEQGINKLWQDVGMVFQNTAEQLFCPTCLEEVEFGPLRLGFSKEKARNMAVRALGQVGLASYEDVVPLNLSGGERRRLALAAVLSMEPKVLILDEPTANLDLINKERLMDILNDLIITKIIISHDSSLIRKCCSFAVLMENGRISEMGRLVEKK